MEGDVKGPVDVLARDGRFEHHGRCGQVYRPLDRGEKGGERRIRRLGNFHRQPVSRLLEVREPELNNSHIN